MVAAAEQYATIDKEKRENVDLKNNAEGLCYEANKQLLLLKDTISQEKQNEIANLIDIIKSSIKTENYESLKSQVNDLKTVIENLLQANQVSSDTNINDI